MRKVCSGTVSGKHPASISMIESPTDRSLATIAVAGPCRRLTAYGFQCGKPTTKPCLNPPEGGRRIEFVTRLRRDVRLYEPLVASAKNPRGGRPRIGESDCPRRKTQQVEDALATRPDLRVWPHFARSATSELSNEQLDFQFTMARQLAPGDRSGLGCTIGLCTVRGRANDSTLRGQDEDCVRRRRRPVMAMPNTNITPVACCWPRTCRSGLPNVETVICRNGWPKAPKVFDGAAAIVVFSDGGEGNPMLPHLDQIDRLMKRGVGLACLHYAVT